MGDALKRRRLLIAAAVVATVLAGLGAAAQAGILSRAEANGSDSSRSAAAAIGDPSTGQDVIAVGETNTSYSSEDESYHASATALRVGDTKVGEAPAGSSEPLAALNGQPTEQLIDGGCDFDSDVSAQAPLCASVLHSNTFADDEFGAGAAWWAAQVRAGGTYVYVLPSATSTYGCGSAALGALVYVLPDGTGADLSEDSENVCDN